MVSIGWCILILVIGAAGVIMVARAAQQQMRRNASDLRNAVAEKQELTDFLARFASGFRSGEGGDGALNATIRYLCERVGAACAALYELKGDTLYCVAVYGHYPLLQHRFKRKGTGETLLEALRREPLHSGEGYLGEVAKNQRSELVSDPALDPRFSIYPGFADLGSVMAAPLFDGVGTLGVVCAVGDGLGPANLTKMIQMVPQVLLALNLARTYAEISRRDRIDQELEFAHSLQTSLLPRSFPQWGNFSIDATTLPAKEVDGDFYDCIPVDDDRLLVVLGDACGKGIPACMLSAMTRSFARSMVDKFTTLPDFLAELNGKLFRDTEADRFITLGCCLLNRRESLLEFGRAGHTDLVEFVHQHLRVLSPSGPALGILPSEVASFDTICIAMEPGTTVMMYSDGLTEALDKKGQEFGAERLGQAFRRACGQDLTLRGVIEEITSEVTATQVEQGDDQTIVVIRHTGAAEENRL